MKLKYLPQNSYDHNLIYFSGGSEAAAELRKELATLRLRVETLEHELKSKEEDLKRVSGGKQPVEDRVKVGVFLVVSLSYVNYNIDG